MKTFINGMVDVKIIYELKAEFKYCIGVYKISFNSHNMCLAYVYCYVG